MRKSKIYQNICRKLLSFSIIRKLYFEKEYYKKIDMWDLEKKEINKFKNIELIKIFNKIKEHENMIILDIGCGEGYSLNYISPIFKETWGADISNIAIKRAKKKFKDIKFVTLDIVTNKLNNKFDIITIQESLYYINNKEITQALSNIKSMINKNGYFINIEILTKKNHEYKHIFKKYFKFEKEIKLKFENREIEILIYKN